jgi:hypothetical protein
LPAHVDWIALTSTTLADLLTLLFRVHPASPD